MAYIKELIESLFDQESEGNIESFKKLIYLAVNQTKIFAPHALELANMICPVLHCIDDTTTKIYALQLLAQLATNYRQQIPPNTYDFPQVVGLLSDENAEVRKAAHYLLLIFIKKYQRIDEIVKGYLTKVRENPDQWKQIQKIIHSFQSLLVIEPKCVTYPDNFSHLDDFLRMVIALRLHQHALIQKASQQTVASFVKNQYTPKILHKMDKVITAQLIQLAQKLNVNLIVKAVPQIVEKHQQKKQKKQQNELQILLDSIEEQSDWKVKSQIVEQISRKLQAEQKLEVPSTLIDKALDLTYDYNFKICITAMNILLTLVVKYPQEAAAKLRKIEDIMIQKICDLKMAVRQIAGKVLKKVFSNHDKNSAKKLLTKLSTCSVVGKEQILNFIQQYFTTVIPSDISLILGEVAAQLSNQNTKIKIKTLDCLVRISGNNIEECKYILQKRLNKVYYDMFLDRLKEKNVPQIKQDKWEDSRTNNPVNKGQTWQAERSPALVQPPNDRFLTKVQFGRKVEKTTLQDSSYDFKYEPPAFGGMQRKQQGKIMMGTTNTSNDTFTNFQNKSEEPIKISKKMNTQSYRPSAVSNFTTAEEKAQQKKLPLKPKPVKKSVTGEQQQLKESGNLVIQSRQYRNKNQQVKQERERSVKAIRATRRQEKPALQKMASSQQTMQKSAKQPFSIKKSTSRKQHQLDYKATQYVSKEELAPVTNPKEMLRDVIANLPNSDWSKQFDSLDGLRRLIKHHEQIFPLILQSLAAIMPEVLKLVQSLRSSVAKNGMITLAQMCQAFKKSMDPFLQAIFVKLFRKAQDTNTFIIQQVNKCITSLCTYCSSPKVAAIIITNSQSKAAPIKAKVVFCIQRLFAKEDYSLGLIKDNPKIVGVMGNYITDSAQQVRNLTKDIFLSLLQNNNQAQVEGIFRKSTKQVWEKWRSILDKDLK